jgi:Gas vesicle synthesis protein GvpL/GvpF
MSLPAPAQVAFDKDKGASYLRHRQSELAAGAEVEAQLSRAAELIMRSVHYRTRAINQQIASTPDHTGLLMAFLVERTRGHRLAVDVEALAKAALPDGAIRVDGPWPPYHFAAPAAAASSEARAA